MSWKTIIPAVLLGLVGTFGVVMGIVLATSDHVAVPPGILFVVIGLALLVAAALVGTSPLRYRTKERKRGARLQAWAAANGWTYNEAPLTPYGAAHAPGTRLRLGANRLLETVIDGMVVTAAESSHRQVQRTYSANGTGTTEVTVYVTMFALRLPGGPWPDLSVRPRPGALRLAGKVMDVPAAGFPFRYRDFDDRFVMQSGDPNAPRVFTQPLLDAHLNGQFREWSLRGGELVIAHQGRLDPEDVPNGVGHVRWLASLLARPAG